MKFLKALIDSIVLLVVFWISWILAVFQSDILLPIKPTDWSLTGFFILAPVNMLILMWLWDRFGPTRSRKQDKNDDD